MGSWQDMKRDEHRAAMEMYAAEAIFRDEVAEGLRCSLFQPNTEASPRLLTCPARCRRWRRCWHLVGAWLAPWQVKKAINDQANLYKDRLKKYHSDREVRGRSYEERLAVDHKREFEKERAYKAMLADVRRGRGDGA